MEKHNRTSFPSKNFTTIEKLEILYTYLSNPIKTKWFYGERYFMILVDGFSRMMWVALLKEKYEAFDKLRYSWIELRINMVWRLNVWDQIEEDNLL